MQIEVPVDEIVQRLRTYTISKWCGMPEEFNPRKLAKKGFICVDKCVLECADKVNCAQTVKLQTSLQFCQALNGEQLEIMLQRARVQIENSHAPLCRFKSKQFKPVVNNWATYLLEQSSSGLSSRSQLYLHAEDIYSALTQSYSGAEGNLKYNLTVALEKLQNLYGIDVVTEVLGRGRQDEDGEEQTRKKVLALTGWACKQEHRDEQRVTSFHLECISCFFKVHSAQLVAAHLDLIKATNHGYKF